MAPRDDRSKSRGATAKPRARPSLVADCARLLRHLEKRDHILLLTTSTRFRGHKGDVPKSTQLALRVRDRLKKEGKRVTLFDVAKLRIHTCEGNISRKSGNECGVLAARLPDRSKNPTGQHRCWASINNKDDQLFEISRELFRSRVVVFFVSVRWGQANSVYQRLFERLSWIENRVSSLGQKPIRQLRDLEAGIVVFGHNWNDAQVLKTQKQNFAWFGWKTPAALSFVWQYARSADVESLESYLGAAREFAALLKTEPVQAD